MQDITVGVISDTHMPARWLSLPERVFDLFSDVDLIIHAGDVGELWVLDQLSRCAPVIAVHGNDETEASQGALPYLQTLTIAGRRITVCHGHYPDRAEELAQRQFDAWDPKLTRWASMAAAHGADIFVFGHTHIPMALEHNGVLLVNGGALASGGMTSRQTVQTLAKMVFDPSAAPGTRPSVTHYDMFTGEVYTPQIDIAAGFKAALESLNERIITPELESLTQWWTTELLPLAFEPVVEAIIPLWRKRWQNGDVPLLDVPEVVTALVQAEDMPESVYTVMQSRPEIAALM